MRKVINVFFLVLLLFTTIKAQSPATETLSGINRTFIVNNVSFEMVFVQGGSFMMGCMLEHGGDCANEEKPPHHVILPDFYIGQFQVTQQLWQAVMGDNPSLWKGDQLPVEKVSWNDCQLFIIRLNSLIDSHFRLPSEAEWEYAARGGHKGKGTIYSGSDDPNEVAWYKNNSNMITHDVGGKQPNELGVYDMTGNVWEWCSDLYGDDYYKNSPEKTPAGPVTGPYRVVRGGSWYSTTAHSRLTVRDGEIPDYKDFYLGFRIALFCE